MREKLKEVINLIEKNSATGEAYIDITTDIDDFSTITGNPEGLRLLASELLRRSIEIEEGYLIMADIPDAKWALDDVLPMSIVGLTSSRNEILKEKEEEKETQESSGSWGCILIAIAVISLVILGIIYLVKQF